MATKEKIWNAVFKQTPLIEVPSSLDELIDYVYLFSFYFNRFKKLRKEVIFPINKRSLIILWSGGFGILATDYLIGIGIEVPHFKGETLKKLKEIYPIKVGSLSNPLDLPFVTYQKELVDVTKAAVDENINLVLLETDAWKDIEGKRFKGYYYNLIEIRNYVESQNKIFIIILHQYPSESRRIFVDMLLKDKFLVYPSLEAAAKSFLKLYEYGKKLKRLSKDDK
jgi:acyl-CoA synthetase (NDP forming)